MNIIPINHPFKPSQITTGSYLQTVNSYNVSNNTPCSFDYLGYLVQTHCPQNNGIEMKTAIDYLTVVFSVKSLEELKEIKGWLSTWLHGVGIATSTKKPTLKHHEHGVLLFPLDETNQTCGSFKWDIKKQLLQLELSGYGCRYIQSSDLAYQPIYALLSQYEGVITRVDIALDDFTGKFNTRYVDKSYFNGDYDPKRGQGPRKQNLGSSKEKGRSRYIGCFGSHKYLLVYEKGKQLGFPIGSHRYINWTRHELSLRRKNNHVIDFDVLLEPDREFVGAFPKVHKRLIKNVKPRCPIRDTALEVSNSLCRSVASSKYQYGKINNGLYELLGDAEQTLSLLTREGKSKKCVLPSFITEKEFIETLEQENHQSVFGVISALVEGHNPQRKRKMR
jgi:DNA relaxase NicK